MGARPSFLILGGINGAGKSTMAGVLARHPDAGAVPMLNPDREADAALSANPALTRTSAEFRGMRAVAEAVELLLDQRRSFACETVLANNSYRRHAIRALDLGFTVHLLFVAVDRVEIAIERVALRVSKGGHNVTEADIRRRWPLTHANLAWFAEHAHTVDVFDNSVFGGVSRRVAHARSGVVELLDPAALPAVTTALEPLAARTR